jgi:hypothetical protein
LRFKAPEQPDLDQKRALDYLIANKTEGNLESTVRAWFDCYLAKPGLESKAKQLDGFIAKWIEEWKLPTGSNLVELEAEMSKLLPLEDRTQIFRDSIEQCVGAFPSDEPLLEAHMAVRHQINELYNQVNALQKKLDEAKNPTGYKFLKSWTLTSLLFRLYKKI